jgi:hypothetical protein
MSDSRSVIGKLDTTHDIYLPNKRAKPTPPRIASVPARSDLPPIGDRAGREAWMRQKQARKRIERRV